MDEPAETRYVDTEEGLLALCGTLAGQPWLALDTEFMREDTYYPRLCLLQIAIPGTVACIDPLALPRLDPLLEVLYRPSVTKVLHACHQDMEIFYHLCGRLPAPVFDTQIAAPLLGLPPQASYARLVEEMLGERLDKAHTRTDWSRRPLSAEQLAYAADDVRFLGPLYLALRARLEAAGRLAWPDQDFAAACEPQRYCGLPEEAWQRVRGTQRMSGRQLAVLRALAAWREQAARRADRPRGWLLRDEVMIELACRAPADKAELEGLRGIGRPTVARYGEELLAAIAEGSRAPEIAPARGRPPPLSESEEALFTAMSALVKERAGQYGLDPAVLASRNDLIDLIRGRGSCRLLAGWRRPAVGEELSKLAARG